VASTVGLVQRMTWIDCVVSVEVGATLSAAVTFVIRFTAADTGARRAFKQAAINVAVRAQGAGYPVEIIHHTAQTEILSVTVGGFDISPIGLAVHGDFYSVTGANIPADAEVVFETSTLVVTVTPDFARPHWVLIKALPAEIPAGRNDVRLETPGGWRTQAVPIDVSAGPAAVVRVLYSGAPKNRPYCIGLPANPGTLTEAGQLVPDALLGNRPAFHDAVAYCLRNLLTVTEDCLRQGDWDREMRFVAVFDRTLTADDSNSLVEEQAPNVMRTRRYHVGPFLSRYAVVVDVALVVHGSTTHTRPWSWAGIEDQTQVGTPYSYDGVTLQHLHYPQTPGSAALYVDMDRGGILPLHECFHGMADLNNGRIVDLYGDATAGTFMINKKFRTQSGDPVPALFANYNGGNEPADPARDGLGYPPSWTSYHCALLDPARPNVMDDFWDTFDDDPQRCRLDTLTYRWLTDHLRAKLTR
jgi:hypothetical protein